MIANKDKCYQEKKERKNSYEWSEKASLRRQYLIKNKNSQPSNWGKSRGQDLRAGLHLNVGRKPQKQ